MSEVLVTVGVLLAFTLVGGFFAAAETALVSLRESQVARLATTGARGRRLALLYRDPNRFLAAAQVGVTLAGFLSAGFGASRLVPTVSPALQRLGLGFGMSNTIAFVAITLVIAYFSLVIGELVPKRIALAKTEGVALASTTPIDITARLARPFIWCLSVSVNAVVRLLGLDPASGKELIGGEELRRIVASQSSLSMEERALIDDVFAAGDRSLSEVMVPRTEVEFLDAAVPVFKAARYASMLPHSRYPVIDGSADEVIGFVHLRDLLAPDRVDRSIRLREIVREVLRFPDSKGLLPALNQMRAEHAHLAIVVDEYGGTAGIVTMEDLVEEIVGEIEDEYDSTDEHAADEVMTIDGLLHLDEFAERTGIQLPTGPYETVAGFIVTSLGRLPMVGDTVAAAGAGIAVVEVDGHRIARVRVSMAENPAPGAPSPDGVDPAE